MTIRMSVVAALAALVNAACIVGGTPVDPVPPDDLPVPFQACPGAATEPEGDIQDFTITDADDVFALEGCQTINGTLTVEASDLVNLDGLETITEVDGPLIILNNPVLENLDGLSNIEGVRGGVAILDNPALVRANFENIDDVEQSISIINNAVLTELDFSSLDVIETGLENNAALQIQRNPALPNLEGFSSLTTIGTANSQQNPDSLIINGNDSLEDLSGLDALVDVDIVAIGIETDDQNNPRAAGNASLENLNGLGALRGVEDENDDERFNLLALTVAFNPELTSLAGLDSLVELQTLNVIGNDSLPDLAGFPESLDTLTTLNIGLVFDNFNINGVGDPTEQVLKFGEDDDNPSEDAFLPVGNASLSTINGLEDIAALTTLNVVFQPAFEDFDGLGATVITQMTLVQNDSLADFTGLEAVTTINRLTVGELRDSENNPLNFGHSLENMEGLDLLTTLGPTLLAGGDMTDLEGLDVLLAWPELSIYDDEGLTNLVGLEGIDMTTLSLGFQQQADLTLLPVGNSAFAELTGLDDPNVTTLRIGASESFDDFTSATLTNIGTLVLAGNESLSSLAGATVTVLGDAFIGCFPDGAGELVSLPNALENLDAFDTLAAVNNLFIVDEPLDTVDLPALGTSTGFLLLDGLPATDLDGFDVLLTVNDFTVRNMEDLTSLAGLETLTTVGGNLLIENNGALANIDALDKANGGALDIVEGNIFAIENPELPEATLTAITDALTTFDGDLVVCGNDGEAC